MSLRSLAAVVRNGLRIEPGHLDESLPHDAAVRLFARFVEQVELETTSFCNRTCSFCPNSFIDRRSERNTMPEDTWQAILDGLEEVRFAGTVVWSRYSEPLSEPRILERVRQVRSVAPGSHIAINTNGDYLDGDLLTELRQAGVSRLMVDLYIPDDAPMTVAFSRDWHDKFLKRVGRRAAVLFEQPEFVGRLDDRMEVVTRVRNATTLPQIQLSDRGGLLQIGSLPARVSPCFLPFKQLVIDWDGSVVPCCQIRSDAAAHRQAIAARIDGTVGLVEGYARLAGWRRGLTSYGPKGGPCATCTYGSYSDDRATRAAAAWSSTPGQTRRLAAFLLRPLLGKRRTW